MRVLKSWPLLFFVISVHAQDSVSTTENKLDSVFHANPVSKVEWHHKKVPDSALQHLRSDDAFWYANAALEKKKEDSSDASFWRWLAQQGWFFKLLWAVAIVSFVAVLLVFLIKSNVFLFRKGAKAIGEKETLEADENIFTIDYKSAIETAIAAGDFAAAIRLHYLHTLRGLASKNLIDYKPDATNSTYLHQMRQSPHYSIFKKLTRQFEYAWYGKFPVTPQAYQTIAGTFNTFHQHMGI